MNRFALTLMTLAGLTAAELIADEPSTTSTQVVNPFEVVMEDPIGGGWDTFELRMSSGPNGASYDRRFRAGLRMLLEELARVEDSGKKEALRIFARDAFRQRYVRQLASRRAEIERLEKELAELRKELEARSDSVDQVIDLQMQSLDLAAAGLLNKEQLMQLGGSRPLDSKTTQSGKQ